MTILQMWKHFRHRFWSELHYVGGCMTHNATAVEDHNRIFDQMAIMHEDFQPSVHRKRIG